MLSRRSNINIFSLKEQSEPSTSFVSARLFYFMLTSKQQDYKKLKEELDNLSPENQWRFFLTSDIKDGFVIYLDNDTTSVYFNEDTELDCSIHMKNDAGDRSGVFDILTILGFKVQYV